MNDSATATLAPAPPQHMRALRKANEVRLARAGLKRRVREGDARVEDVVLECPWEAANMTAAELLMSQSRWGTTRCAKFLGNLSMPEGKTIGSMTQRQRDVFAAALTSKG